MNKQKRNKRTTYWQLFLVFFKAGTFTFAGGLAMLPVIQKDIVEKYKLLEKDEFLEYATLSQALPGIIAINCASFVGRKAAGTIGMLVAAFGASVSAFVLMLTATILMQFLPESGPVMGAMRCVRAASSALILSAAFSLGQHNLKSAFAVIVVLSVLMLVLFLKFNTLLAVVLSGVAGYVYQRIKSRKGGKKDAC